MLIELLVLPNVILVLKYNGTFLTPYPNPSGLWSAFFRVGPVRLLPLCYFFLQLFQLLYLPVEIHLRALCLPPPSLGLDCKLRKGRDCYLQFHIPAPTVVSET